jgi:hypothetical protein
VVSNLPILQSPIRTFCNKIGLGVLFSTHNTHNTPFEGRTIGGGGGGSYPLRSNKSNPGQKGTVTAWDSDERILGEDGTQKPVSPNIVVGREVAVESERGSLRDGEPAGWTASVTTGSSALGKPREG